jgi:hypothetical protein
MRARLTSRVVVASCAVFVAGCPQFEQDFDVTNDAAVSGDDARQEGAGDGGQEADVRIGDEAGDESEVAVESGARDATPADVSTDAPADASLGADAFSCPDGSTPACIPGGCSCVSCPPGGCRCDSNTGNCLASEPYQCNQGAECCNWRPPGC